MMNKLKLFAIMMFAFFGVVGFVSAAALNWSVAQTIDLTSLDIDLTIASGSGATSLVVNAGNIQVVVPTGSTFTVTPASGELVVTGGSSSSVAHSCSNGISTVIISGDSNGNVITITPNGGTCSSGSGGGGGSKAKPKTTTPPVVAPTPTPTPVTGGEACSYNLGMATLKNGSRGAGVMELQRFLNATMNLGLVVDGALGPKTIAVMMQWQNANGLVSDGLIGPMTKAKINGIAATRCATPATPATAGVSPTTPATPNAQGYAFGSGVVKEGTKGEACKAWQMFLNDKANAGLMADGNCGAKTMVAAKAWQASVGLTADGMLGAMSRVKALVQ